MLLSNESIMIMSVEVMCVCGMIAMVFRVVTYTESELHLHNVVLHRVDDAPPRCSIIK